MPEDLRLRLGTEVATITFTGTPAKIGNVIERFMRRKGITVTDIAQTDMLAFLAHWVDETKRVSKEAQTAELNAEQQATIQSTVDADNDF